ncbi:bifunctional DNA-formamidopyrimidine glycosylase/DNA-(apurinic or apyrimidinic site) lyase [Gammaproteobacteria bacterium]|nr:bifunctional DNA-formamidopyrimidine glycosylase/DNA-(apurinic or apyrimidinic site) lyase [Gammaproteobacteria bacterium]
MPELPEVQTVLDGIQDALINQKITAVWRSHQKLRSPFQLDLADQLVSQTVEHISRRAKFIIIRLGSGIDLVMHLGMSGKLLLKNQQYQTIKHDHVVLQLSSNQQLVYHDPRRFGYFFWTPSAESHLAHYGSEPLSAEFTATYLLNKTTSRRTSIKTLIMDQTVVVGVGNIYACEALFMAKIVPSMMANALTPDMAYALVVAVKDVLSKAIQKGGTTLKDYRQASDELGYFQQELFVYGRAGDSCYTCGDEVKVIKQSGRSTFYCDSCQC